MSILRSLRGLFRRSRFSGLIVSPSPLLADGSVVLKQHGREVGHGLLAELRRHPKACDEIVVSPADWHGIVSGRIG